MVSLSRNQGSLFLVVDAQSVETTINIYIYFITSQSLGPYAHNKARVQHCELRALLFSNSAGVLLRPAELRDGAYGFIVLVRED